ncbi:MAG: class I SAM-dependent methyltransferase [Phaeovulum sp.]|uniref:class I SAM-dependent methyltransferase n=1 Tax=Phaeovulum sp. TaxID=2934796 RepID=UPI0027309670|nr:class I SAM-dependent methyltransferase [Phaeovulum sp.]MDP2062951.1 class I SAM-dependent methyltransferase [Phaeovulum sp.]
MISERKMDTAAFKQATRVQWDSAAAGWDRHGPEIRAWLRVPTDAMLKMAGISAGQTVLDVAAGAGDQTLDIAERVGAEGAVVATDISEGILTHALGNAARAGHANVRTHPADAEDLGLEDASFDAAVCRLGLMFLPDPLAGLKEIHRVLKPGGRFCGMVFAGPDMNPCLRILMSTAMRHAGLAPRDPFQPGGLVSLGKPGLMDGLMQRAGFRSIATTRMEVAFRLPRTADYLTFIRDSAGPVLQILAPLDEAARAAAWADIAAQLDFYQVEDGWIGPNTLLLTAGRK